jgi:hypothetical protein
MCDGVMESSRDARSFAFWRLHGLDRTVIPPGDSLYE